MSKGTKKSGWKTAFIILLAAVVIFIIWALFSDDEETSDTKVDDSSALSTSNTSYSASQTGTAASGDAVSVLFDTGAIREKKVVPKGNGEDRVTILVYMNGSNLETEDGEATTDLSEMVAAGSSDKVNILVQTMGTKSWSRTYGIASDRSQIYKVNGDGLKLVKDDLGQLNCNESSTLANFIMWGVQNYPADRYILQFWNHGGGPVYGFGYDDNTESEDSLSIDEIQAALKTAGVYFDFVGMDCCIMSCMEVCCALYDYCDYMILSEDFESGLGWSYKGWISKLIENTSTSTPDVAKIAIDDMVSANENDTEGWGDDSILALIDESMMKVLYTAWTDFAYANESSLIGSNYSRKMTRAQGGRELPLLRDKGYFSDWLYGDGGEEEYYMSDYYVTDIMSVAGNIDSAESEALSSAVNQSIVYLRASSGDAGLTGISVTLPYGDSNFYNDLSKVFTNCGFDSDYVTWLQKFVSASGSDDFYDYDDWDDSWDGWDEYEDDYDWNDWDYCDDDDYWCDDYGWGWDDFGYDDSWNYWYDEDDWYCDDGNYNNNENYNYNDYDYDWEYQGDDWYYDDYDYYW